MEETLGKRIVLNRKRLGLTQDRLAELLGVTAQAVSKWENDQSCPDITTLPKLAEIFDITTDELLGLPKKEPAPIVEVVTQTAEDRDEEPNGLHVENGSWEFQWDGGRRGSVGFAIWILLVGGLLFASNVLQWHADFWEIAWPSGLLVFGLFGLYPKFSVIRLGCTLLGIYFLINEVMVLRVRLNDGLILPVCLLILGLSLLVDALHKPRKPKLQMKHNGMSIGKQQNHCTFDGELFDCSTSFGSNEYPILLPRLSGGTASVSFGELTLDLRGCEEFAGDCRVELNCSFGELTVLIPKSCRADCTTSTAFGDVSTQGAPSVDASAVVQLDCNVSFGEITIRYI